MINNVTLVGRLTRDPDFKYTPQNLAVTTFSLAVNRQFKNSNGEREADCINWVICRQQAENLANWTKKETLIGITGCIQTRNYENQQGQCVYAEVVADTFQMLESRQERGNIPTPPPAANQTTQKSTSPVVKHKSFLDLETMNINDDGQTFKDTTPLLFAMSRTS